MPFDEEPSPTLTRYSDSQNLTDPLDENVSLAGIERPACSKLEDGINPVKRTKILLVNDNAEENFRMRKMLETKNCE